MIELKQDIINYLIEQYKITRWPFVQRIQLAKDLNKGINEVNTALNELFKEKKIIHKKGVNDALVAYTGDKKMLNEIKHLI